MNNNIELLEQFKKEFAEFAEQKQEITISFSPIQLWAIFSNLQLALRHPQNTGELSKIAFDVARKLQMIIATNGSFKIVAEMGWNPEYDEVIDGNN